MTTIKGYLGCGISRYNAAGIAVSHNFREESFLEGLLLRNDEAKQEHGPVMYDVYISKTRHEVPERLVEAGVCSLSRLGKLSELTKRLPDHHVKMPKEVRLIRDIEKPRRVKIYMSKD
ncbi:MAG: hypothetical protein AABW73_02115 [Nanoarchaeota archaeon]